MDFGPEALAPVAQVATEYTTVVVNRKAPYQTLPAVLAAAKDMTPEQRQQMIHTMVDGLAERLAANGKDIEGWLRLARARVMLGEKDKAEIGRAHV